MADSCQIDTATSADLAEMTALLGILFSQEEEFFPDAARQDAGLRLILDDPQRGWLFVARVNGRIVGMVSLLITVSTACGGLVGCLEDMVVLPAFRSRGIGALLLLHAIAVARDAKLLRITLMTDSDNLDARRFYSRHGFSPSFMQPWRLFLDMDLQRE